MLLYHLHSSQNTHPDFWCVTLNGFIHPGTPWAEATGQWWAHGHMETTGSVTLSAVVRFEQTQRQIVSTVSRKHHHGIGWVVKHTGHVSFEQTPSYWDRFTILKVSALQCTLLRLWLTYLNWQRLFWLNIGAVNMTTICRRVAWNPGTCSCGRKGNHTISSIINEVIL